MSKIDDLIKRAQDKLLEVQKEYEENSERLEKLLTERGQLQASEAIGDITETDRSKIKRLPAEILRLKDRLEQGHPLASALKGKILSLKKEREEQEKEQVEKQQVQIEEKMASISKRFISVLGEANKMNSELQGLYATWKGLSEKSGRLIFNKKIIQPSSQMLNLVCGVLKNEWEGKGGKGRQFYNRIDL